MLHDELIAVYSKLLPLVLLVVLGILAGKIKIETSGIINLLTYIIIPATLFNIGLKASIEAHYLALPFVAFFAASAICLFCLVIMKRVWHGDRAANILAFSAGASNSGYFGLPVAALFLEPHVVGIFALTAIGGAIYEYTIGVYIIARGDSNAKKSFLNILKLPILYAFAFGLLCNEMHIAVPDTIANLLNNLQVCYVVLGMLTIGLSLYNTTYQKAKWSFIMTLLTAKYTLLPLITVLLIAADIYYFELYCSDVYRAMLLLSFMPPAVNSVIFANLYNNSQAESAVSVLLGVVISVLILPLLPL